MSDTKECPFCAEIIKSRAIKCKHCGSMLTEEAMTKFALELSSSMRGSQTASAVSGEPPPPPALPPADGGAARLATILFADLSGFTSMTTEREPEEMREIMNALFSDLAGSVERFGGKVDKYIGDCVMAVWGLDDPQPEDPVRAANAGLSMLHRMKSRAERLSLPLALHVGISTGRVVFGRVGAGPDAARSVIGEAVNLASRLCGSAPAGEVFASEETWRRIGDRFAATTRELELKGIGRARAYSIHPGHARTRVTRRVMIDFHAREAESGRIGSLLESHRESSYNRRTGVLVVGQGGVGKSRLCSHALRNFGSDLHILFAQAVPAETPAFGVLVAAWLRELIGGGGRDEIAAWFESHPKLEPRRRAVTAILASAEESGASGGFGDTLPLDEELARFFRAVSMDQPLVLSGADIQWADPLSIDLCRLISLSDSSGSRVALVLDGRPGASVDRIRSSDHIDTIDLAALSISAMESIFTSVLDAPPPFEWVRSVHRRTGGIFIHFSQVLDALAEAAILVPGARDGRWRLVHADRELPVPESLQDLIWLRIDRLPSWPREVLLHASICGLRFPRRILATAIGDGRANCDEALSELHADGFLHVSAENVSFEHGSIRETARRMLLKNERKRIAERILGELEERLTGDELRPLAPDLFRDADRDTDLRKFLALDAYRLIRSYRLVEARTLLDAVGRDPWPVDESGERARAVFLTSMSRLAEAEQDLASARRFQDEAVAILRRCNPRSRELVRALGLLGRIATKCENWDFAVETTLEAVETSKAMGDEKSLGVQIHMFGWIAEQREDWATALENFEESLKHQRSERGMRISHGSVGRVAVELGDFEKAGRHGELALSSAHRDGVIKWNPHAYISILATTGRVAWKTGDVERAFEHLETGLDLARATKDDEALFMVVQPLAGIAADIGDRASLETLVAMALEAARRLGARRLEKKAERFMVNLPDEPVVAPGGARSRLGGIVKSLSSPPPARDAIREVSHPIFPSLHSY